MKLTILLFFILTTSFLFGQVEFKNNIVISNKSHVDRVDEIITLPEPFIHKKITGDRFPVFYKKDSLQLSQIIQIDGEVKAVLIQVTVKAKATDTLKVKWVDKENYPGFEQSTNSYFSLRSVTGQANPEIIWQQRLRGFTQDIAKPIYQMEGPGIENDKVAFRFFFDHRNGIDIYGKTTDQLVLNRIGLTGSWHKLQDWGMDILKQGGSLGAGALAIYRKGTFARLADADTSTYNLLYKGPLQSAFVLGFKGWNAAGIKGDGAETIKINKGNFFYQNQIRMSHSGNFNLVSGISNLYPTLSKYIKYNRKWSSISTYGPQADGTQTGLGLAVFFKSRLYKAHQRIGQGETISDSFLVRLQEKRGKYDIFFAACWEKTDPLFSTEEGFLDYLSKTAEKLSHPLKIKCFY